MRGTIVGFQGALFSGIGHLIIRGKHGVDQRIPCESAQTFNMLSGVFGGSIRGKRVEYTVDATGLLAKVKFL